MSAANRNRGARAEVAVVNYLRVNGWPDARRYLAGDGRQPGDVDFHPLVALEVKDVASSSWPSWCRQAAAEARPGMVPVVVRRTRGVPDVGEWECRFWFGGWNEATGRAPLPECYPLPRRIVNGMPFATSWYACDFAAFVAGLARFDALDQSLAGVRTYPQTSEP